MDICVGTKVIPTDAPDWCLNGLCVGEVVEIEANTDNPAIMVKWEESCEIHWPTPKWDSLRFRDEIELFPY